MIYQQIPVIKIRNALQEKSVGNNMWFSLVVELSQHFILSCVHVGREFKLWNVLLRQRWKKVVIAFISQETECARNIRRRCEI